MVALVAVLCVLQALRQAGDRSWNTVWAEDGAVYLQHGDHVGSLWHTYAGYLQVVPRLVGIGANLVPLAQVARYFTAVSAIVTALIAVAVFVLSRPLVTSPWLRAVLAGSTFLVPGVLGENLNTPTNLNWVLLFACWWALLVVPTSRGRTVTSALLVAATTLSTVLALTYLPFAALLAVKRRDRRSRVVLVTYFAAALVQGLYVVTANDPEAVHHTHVEDLPGIYGARVLGSGVFGDSLVKTLWNDHGYVVAYLALLVVVPLVVFLVAKSAGVHRCLGTISVAYSVGLFFFAVDRRGSTGFRMIAGAWNGNGGRFVALSLWLLLSGLAVLVTGARVSVRVRQIVIAALVLQFTVVAVANYRESNGRSNGPGWREEIASVTTWCESHPRLKTAIPISPPGWFAVLSCDRVLD